MNEVNCFEEIYLTITKVKGGYVINTTEGTQVVYNLEKVIEITNKTFTPED